MTPVERYRTIVADPPWPYKTPGKMGTSKGDPGASSVERYGGMPIADLCALAPLADDNAHLYLWTTNGFLREAHEIAVAWGFRPITMLTWAKVQQDDHSTISASGMGYYFRGATEHCLFGVRGSLRLNDRTLPTAYLWPRLPHSVKPDAFYDLVEKASPGPYLEMFARRARFLWDYYGDESFGTAKMGEVA